VVVVLHSAELIYQQIFQTKAPGEPYRMLEAQWQIIPRYAVLKAGKICLGEYQAAFVSEGGSSNRSSRLVVCDQQLHVGI
jgi:hypothetical protein